MRHQANVVSVRSIRIRRRQALARRLFATTMYISEMPELSPNKPLVAFYVQEGSVFTFAAHPDLSDFERQVAAWGCAIRIQENGDDVHGFTRSKIREVIGAVAREAGAVGCDPQRYFDVHALGAE